MALRTASPLNLGEMSLCLSIGILQVFTLQIVSARMDALKNLSLLCVEEGRFPDPTDCRSYVECIGKGQVSPRHLQCPGSAYDPHLARCIHQQKAAWCIRSHQDGRDSLVRGRGRNRSVSGGSPVRSPKHDHLCSAGVGFACASCVESVVCASGRAFVHACPSSTRCVRHRSFSGGVCYPQTGGHCFCHSSGLILPDLHDPAAFLLCQDAGREPQVVYCSDGHRFDAEGQVCVAPPTLPPCVTEGVFPLDGDCRWYYSCSSDPSSGGWLRQHGTCALGMVYNRVLGRCSEPEDLPTQDPCVVKKAPNRYTCTLWQLFLVILFPHRLTSICS